MSPRELANKAALWEAAEILGVRAGCMRQAVSAGALPADREGGRVIVDLEDAEAWNQSRRMGRPAKHEIDETEVRALARARCIKPESARRALIRRTA